jgi:hypothetical protein
VIATGLQPRTVVGAVAGVSHQEIEELSAMLLNLGKRLSQRNNHAISMIEAVDLIDMELEREVFDPPATEGGMIEQDCDYEDDEKAMRVLTCEEHDMDTFEDGDVDDKDPKPTITLAQAKALSEKLFAFVNENCALVKQANTKLNNADYVDMADILRFTIQRMSSSRNTRQTSISEYFSNTVSS